MSQHTDSKSYKTTLNLPKTRFPMKANLVQNEPASLKRWQKQNLYQHIRKQRAQARRYVFHDGPPYANGAIHLGHLLNKVLKDFVVRSKTMAGFDCPYVPGWDCHGLPIEHKVMQDLGDMARDMVPMQIRKRCGDDAKKFVKLQGRQMQRLLTLADYDNPYLTMSRDYEAATLEVFAEMVGKGLVYRALKPVHWSIANQTALAEAELEYEDRNDTSVYVLFEIMALPTETRKEGESVSKQTKLLLGAYLMIWTTTPWTLPANRAVAVHAEYKYGIYELKEPLENPKSSRQKPLAASRIWCLGKILRFFRTLFKNKQKVIVACELAPKVLGQDAKLLRTVTGHELRGIGYTHPFMPVADTKPGEPLWSVVTADYVTLDDGTGLVHTAPGHGIEDYQTALRKNLSVYCPVQADGTYDDTVPDWLRGKDVWQANELIVQRLRDSGHLFHDHQFTHSYPHDWRSKTPVIFRATEQWFIGVDRHIDGQDQSLRSASLDHAEADITFIPQWGRNRMRGMLESRPDWCISRQRAWGLPIPAFFSKNGKAHLLTKASVQAVAKNIRQHGSDYWFTATPAELLDGYDPQTDPGAPQWIKDSPWPTPSLTCAHDIFDVWFESGSSWNAVLRKHLGEEYYPADLYLEGSDQHRGWFQLSLLPALGVTGQAPFKTVLTHGFMVDKDGRKMSKSQGNALDIDELMKHFGADVCRWWVATLNTDNDIKVDESFFKLAGEEYRKVRNTIRYLLSNLSDFDPGTRDDIELQELDKWILGEWYQVVLDIRQAYEEFAFSRVSKRLFNFCNDTLSSVYLTAVKDRLYCDKPDSPRRRSSQAAMYKVANDLCLLLAPILPHTTDEAWHVLHRQQPDSASIHLECFPETVGQNYAASQLDWDQLLSVRSDVWLKQIETFRQKYDVDNPLDIGLRVNNALIDLSHFNTVDLADLCGISRFVVDPKTKEIEVVDLRDQPRCQRSWKRDTTVKQRSDGGMLSDRDAEAVGV